MIDPRLYEFATPAQARKLRAVDQHGSMRAAARALGLNKNAIGTTLAAVQRKAALQGYSPAHHMTRTVPDGFQVKGVSTYYNKDGKPTGQWVKSSADDQRRLEMLREAIAAMCEDVPKAGRTKPALGCVPQLCNVYTVTDAHIGMLAWHRETGANWDLEIAEQTILGAFSELVERSPKASECVINQLGDFLHFDGLLAQTPTSHHILDADGRFGKLVKVAIRVLRTLVSKALEHHERVVLVIAEGNHDLASSVWLRNLFAMHYEVEPRVRVVDSELPYYVHQHGKTMLGFHHGHLKRNDDLPLFFAAQFPQVWGATVKRYLHVGHRHHVEDKEHAGVIVCQHATLAAKDAYAARGGWLSERQIRAMTYHSDFGLVGTSIVIPEMLEAA